MVSTRWLKYHRERVLKEGRLRRWRADELSLTGYLPDSPHRHRPYNVIPSGHLTMRTVPHDILAVANTGQMQWMTANSGEYNFQNASWVHETPIKEDTEISPFGK